MIVSISQPAYLPWMGYFHRIQISDLHIVLDHVQYEKRSFIARNKVLGKNGQTPWLSVPVNVKGLYKDKIKINDVRIDREQNWQEKHYQTLRHCYGKTDFWPEYADIFKVFYDQEYTGLIDVIEDVNAFLFDTLNINTKRIRSSAMNASSDKSDLILDLCLEAGATTYISGPFGRDYLDLDKFKMHNIEVVFHDYQTPSHDQSAENFIPNLSVLDALFHVGKEHVQNLLQAEGIELCKKS